MRISYLLSTSFAGMARLLGLRPQLRINWASPMARSRPAAVLNVDLEGLLLYLLTVERRRQAVHGLLELLFFSVFLEGSSSTLRSNWLRLSMSRSRLRPRKLQKGPGNDKKGSAMTKRVGNDKKLKKSLKNFFVF